MINGREKNEISTILYKSVSKISEADLENEVSNILEKSQKNNKIDQITGLLIYDKGCWFQALEGRSHNVKKCFSIIKDDHRHKDIMVLIEEFSGQRRFDRWSMGFADPFELNDYQKISSTLHNGSPAEVLNEISKISKERWLIQSNAIFPKL